MSRARRTIDRSVSQVRDDIDDFDQSRPDFEDADTAANFLAGARPPAGCIDLDRDAEIVPAGRDHEGVALHLKSQGSTLARVVRGEVRALSVRRVAVEGGVAIEGRFGGEVAFTSPAMSDEDADRIEPAYRDALTTYASVHPLTARAAPANDGEAGRADARRAG